MNSVAILKYSFWFISFAPRKLQHEDPSEEVEEPQHKPVSDAKASSYLLRQVGVNRSIHQGIHKQTNAFWSIPKSQTVFYHFKICRLWEL